MVPVSAIFAALVSVAPTAIVIIALGILSLNALKWLWAQVSGKKKEPEINIHVPSNSPEVRRLLQGT